MWIASVRGLAGEFGKSRERSYGPVNADGVLETTAVGTTVLASTWTPVMVRVMICMYSFGGISRRGRVVLGARLKHGSRLRV